jgi:hypothetical protein
MCVFLNYDFFLSYVLKINIVIDWCDKEKVWILNRLNYILCVDNQVERDPHVVFDYFG